MRKLSIVLALLATFSVVASSAIAQDKKSILDWPSTVVAVSGQTADIVSTVRFLHNGSGCTEANPRFGPHPTTGALITGKTIALGITIGGSMVLNALANHSESPRVRRFLRIASRSSGYYAGGVGAWFAVQNVHLCGW